MALLNYFRIFEFSFWLSLVIGVLLAYLGVSNFHYWKNRNIKYSTPFPFVGNLLQFFLKLEPLTISFDRIYYKFENEKFVGFFQMKEPILLVRDPELITDILIKSYSTHFHDRGFSFFYINKKLNPLLNTLFFSNGERWKILRQKFSPSFTSGKLKLMYEQMEECSNRLLKLIDNKLEREGNMELKEICDKVSTDIIGTCVFGLELNSLTDSESEFTKYGRKVFSSRIRDLVRVILWSINPKLLTILNISDFPQYITNFYLNVIENSKKFRLQNNIKRNDIFQLLISLENSKYNPDDYSFFGEPKNPNITNDSFDDLDVASNAFIFLTAGSETTSSSLSFCLYELALNLNIQDKLRKEINNVKEKHGGKITVDSLQEFSYLECVIAETLRKYPVFPVLNRQCTENYLIPGTNTVIKKGEKIAIPLRAIHYDPKYYPNPKIFDPERFSSENKIPRQRGTYLPFGDGPKYCLGMRFAKMEMKLILGELISRYEFKPCQKTQIPLKFRGDVAITKPVRGNWLNVTKIHS